MDSKFRFKYLLELYILNMQRLVVATVALNLGFFLIRGKLMKNLVGSGTRKI